jgi:DNA repair protein RecO (recombination protein O)
MEWHDSGLITGTRPHGETSLIASVFTRQHGLVAGLLKGARARGRNPWQPGNLVQCRWYGRLPEQLGFWQLEMLQSVAAGLLHVPVQLQALASLCALLQLGLGEGEAHPALYDATAQTLGALAGPDWLPHYALWELHYLEELGFGLDLHVCAVTGTADDLRYVSPRTGRAVCASVGAAYADQLFAYPDFWTRHQLPSEAEAAAALRMTSHFLTRRVLEPHRKKLPEVRAQVQAAVNALLIP